MTEDELRALLTFKSSGIICFGQIANASVLNALPACITELSFDLLTPQLASVLPKSVGKIIYQDVLPGALRALPNTVALVNMSRIPSSQEIYEILHAEIYTPQALLDQATAEQRNDYWKAVSSQGCLKAAHKAMQHRNFVITHAHLLRAAQIDPTNPNIFIADQALRQAQLHAVVRPSSPTLDFEGERYEDHDGSRAFFISFGDMAQGAATPRTVNVKRASEPDASSPTAQFPRFES